MQKLWSEFRTKWNKINCQNWVQQKLFDRQWNIYDIYLLILCFLYPLYLSNRVIIGDFTEKELLYYMLTLAVAVLCIPAYIKSRNRIRKKWNHLDRILFFSAILLVGKGCCDIVFGNKDLKFEIFLFCMIGSLFILKKYQGKSYQYLNIWLLSFLIIYLDLLYCLLTGNSGLLGTDVLLKQTDAPLGILLVFGISAVLYENENRNAWRKFYFFVFVLGSIALSLFDDMKIFSIASLFLLSMPLFFLPTVSFVKRNLILCFSYFGIVANLPILYYMTDLETSKESFFFRYGIYIDILLIFIGVGIQAYWKKVPYDRNPACILMRKVQKWYKKIMFLMILFEFVIIGIGGKSQEFPIFWGSEFVSKVYVELINFFSHRSFPLSIIESLGLGGIVFWLVILWEIYQRVRIKSEDTENRKIYKILAILYVIGSFFYDIGIFVGPEGIILLSFAVTDNSQGQDNKNLPMQIGDRDEKGIISNQCRFDEILS